jgi:hypothetical protein
LVPICVEIGQMGMGKTCPIALRTRSKLLIWLSRLCPVEPSGIGTKEFLYTVAGLQTFQRLFL